MISSHDGAPDEIYSGNSMHGTVLIVDDDHDISRIAAEVLSEEGFDISGLGNAQSSLARAEVARLEPDVLLLDGSVGASYSAFWMGAAWMRERTRSVSVVMFAAHLVELAEAQIGLSERGKRAAFAGFLPKPWCWSKRSAGSLWFRRRCARWSP